MHARTLLLAALALVAFGADAAGPTGTPSRPTFQTLTVSGNTPTFLKNSISNSYTSLRLYNDLNSPLRALEIDYAGTSYASALINGAPTGESGIISTTGAYPLCIGTANTCRLLINAAGLVSITANNGIFRMISSGGGRSYEFNSHATGGFYLTDVTNGVDRLGVLPSGGVVVNALAADPGAGGLSVGGTLLRNGTAVPRTAYGRYTTNGSTCAVDSAYANQGGAGCVRNSAGVFTITLSPAFAAKPSCIANPQQNTGSAEASSASAVVVSTVNAAGSPMDPVGGVSYVCHGN